MISTTVKFDNVSELQYNENEVEIDASSAKLKLLGPQGSETFVATAKITEVADRHLGTSALTPIGANVNRVQVGSIWYYDLTNTSVGRYYSIPDATNFNSFTNVYTIRFKIVFPYSGSPSSNNYIIATNSGGNTTSLINLWHRNTGLLELNIYASPAGAPASISLPFVAVSGQEYEMEIVNTGSMLYLFVDGLVFGSISHTINAGARAQFKIGTNYLASERSLFYMRDLQIFSTAQHTENFASELPRLVNLYSKSSFVEPDAFITAEGIFYLDSMSFGVVNFVVKIDNDYFYITNQELTLSDKTLSQSNTQEQLIEYISLINSYIEAGKNIKIVPILSCGDNGDIQSGVIDTYIEYDFYSIDTKIGSCIVYGFSYDSLLIAESLSLRVFTSSVVTIGAKIIVIDKTVTADSLGYFEIELPYNDKEIPYDFEMVVVGLAGKRWKDNGKILIKNETSATFNSVRI